MIFTSHTGLLTGAQPCTYDRTTYGIDTFIGCLYLCALRYAYQPLACELEKNRSFTRAKSATAFFYFYRAAEKMAYLMGEDVCTTWFYRESKIDCYIQLHFTQWTVRMVTTFANQILLGLKWVIGNCYIFVYCINRFRTLLKSIMIDFVLVRRTLTLIASRTKSGTRR